MDTNAASAPDFLARLHRLETDGLPTHEHRFFELLQNQSHQLAALSKTLLLAHRTIIERMEEVNRSLSYVTADDLPNLTPSEHALSGTHHAFANACAEVPWLVVGDPSIRRLAYASGLLLWLCVHHDPAASGRPGPWGCSNAIMLAILGAMAAGLDAGLFWGSLAVALLIAGAAAFPINRWLISHGKGHAVVHAHHHQ